MQPFFTIVLPSTLRFYATAAKNRKEKLHRAVQSVIDQSIPDWELLVISDGCQQTFDEMKRYIDHPSINCIMIQKAPMWSGGPRNKGIEEATGQFITYLDNDDYFGKDHLKIIKENIAGDTKLVWYNDLIHSEKGFIERQCNINAKFQHGTSNVTHINEPAGKKILWSLDGYEHDYHFIRLLLDRYQPVQIPTPQYHVCHIHTKFDV